MRTNGFIHQRNGRYLHADVARPPVADEQQRNGGGLDRWPQWPLSRLSWPLRFFSTSRPHSYLRVVSIGLSSLTRCCRWSCAVVERCFFCLRSALALAGCCWGVACRPLASSGTARQMVIGNDPVTARTADNSSGPRKAALHHLARRSLHAIYIVRTIGIPEFRNSGRQFRAIESKPPPLSLCYLPSPHPLVKKIRHVRTEIPHTWIDQSTTATVGIPAGATSFASVCVGLYWWIRSSLISRPSIDASYFHRHPRGATNKQKKTTTNNTIKSDRTILLFLCVLVFVAVLLSSPWQGVSVLKIKPRDTQGREIRVNER